MYTEIKTCLGCNSENLTTVLSLGEQVLTGVFLKSVTEKINKGPLDLVWCEECRLFQMKHSYSLEEMYGDNYGHRSGLNVSIVQHLQNKIRMLELLAKPSDDGLVINIESNDATSLKAYKGNHQKVAIHPTGGKF
jgi:hypothetical protein